MKNFLFLQFILIFFTSPSFGEIFNIKESDNLYKNLNPDKVIENLKAKKMIEDISSELKEPQQIGLIIDGSGSMAQILDKNKSKMFYSKKILKEFTGRQWKLKNNIGIRAYGNTVKGKCDDITLISPYSNKNLPTLETTLEKLEPTGMTPLHKSIDLTIDEIKTMPGKKNIVIVTDGEDTCGGDPCKSAERLKKEKLDITFYIVALGFEGPSDELSKLTCLGDVQVANNNESFQDAISQISSKISTRQNLKVNSPNPMAPVYLYRIENEKKILDRVFYAQSEQTVAEGVTYEVVVGLNPLYKFSDVFVPPNKKVVLTVDGEGSLIANYFNSHLNVQILDKNNKVVTKFRSDIKQKIPTGKWSVRIFKEPFYEYIIPDYFIYPDGVHSINISGVGLAKVQSSEIKGVYIYSSSNELIDYALSNSIVALKSGSYIFHSDDTCTFSDVKIKDRKEILVLPCP